jgi:hypothetical protein
MSKNNNRIKHGKPTKTVSSSAKLGLGLGLPAAGVFVLALSPAAHAFQLYDGSQNGNNLEINLNFDASYTGLFRVHPASKILTSGITNANGNDGDANLRHGVVGNTFELLPVLDIKDGSFGMHFSGEFFVNTVYLGTTQNNETSTINPVLPKSNDFASETRTANGLNGRMLDAFLYDSWTFDGEQQITVKAGQQTLFWGQSLFSTNGISGGQAPIDTVTAQNLINPQSQQVFLPVGQIVLTYQPNSTYTLQGYYQYQWEPYSFQGVGSYFSGTDVIGPGGQREILFPGFYANRTRDVSPESQNGQFGLSTQAQYGNFDLGLFTLRYDAKTPQVATSINLANLATSNVLGSYTVIYPRDIWLYGASGSTTIGATNIAGEVSLRTHNPLVTAGPVTESGEYIYNANSNPSYPVGNTITGIVNAIYGSPALRFDPGGITVEGEVEYDQLIRVTANKALLAPNRTAAASEFDVQATPAYFEVLPRLELQFPVSVQYNFAGNSEVQATENHGTGSYTLGVTATYRTTWTAALSYVGYFGKINPNGLAPEASTNADRAYLALNLSHTF